MAGGTYKQICIWQVVITAAYETTFRLALSAKETGRVVHVNAYKYYAKL